MGRISLGVAMGCVALLVACDPAAGATMDDYSDAGAGGDAGRDADEHRGGYGGEGGGTAGERAPDPGAKVGDPTGGCDVTPVPAQGLPDAGTGTGTGTVGLDAGIDPNPMVAPVDVPSSAADDDAGIALPPPDDEMPGTPAGPRSPNRHGDLVITEIMMDPTLLSDATGEWIELYNASGVDLDLGDCVLHDDNRDRFTLGRFVVRRDARVVLGRTVEAAPTVDVVYSGMTLANTEDVVTITCDGVMIDRVAYGPGYPRPAGRTMQLDPNAHTAVDNDAAGAWCAGPTGGTPGLPNTACGGT